MKEVSCTTNHSHHFDLTHEIGHSQRHSAIDNLYTQVLNRTEVAGGDITVTVLIVFIKLYNKTKFLYSSD